ncbi:MAG: CoB--CoM heterodisulfide reductase iron-sulfur subunit B family protein [Deltaproteobacteria bacterium]|nr:CoB--CoM heterodisulfide reductase iron-sulfur subunit B family protein [Deltaproteobacteria bacterium]
MDYFLYQGCSLEASGIHYMISLEAIGKVLGLHFKEIGDWNCCGASISYVGGNELSVDVLAARNLALAEAQGGMDIVAPCSSCYIVLNKVNHKLKEDPELMAKVNEVLAEGNLKYSGKLKVRHILDVLYNDVGPDKIKAAVKKPLKGLKVAGYVGCQTVRPYGEYDSVEKPVIQDRILEALGAEAVPFPKKMRCCGSGLFLTELEACFDLARDILEDAQSHGGQIISTACPMCQMNLEAYQKRMNKALGTHFNIPVVFITQLMAVAFGLSPKKDAALDRLLIPAEPYLKVAAA